MRYASNQLKTIIIKQNRHIRNQYGFIFVEPRMDKQPQCGGGGGCCSNIRMCAQKMQMNSFNRGRTEKHVEQTVRASTRETESE